MDLLYQIFIDPFVQMGQAPDLLVQTLWEGLVSGVLYALIALGFVLIFKASGVFNFAQGIMVVFAALTLVGLYTLLRGWGVRPGDLAAFLALVLTIGVMFVLAVARRAADAAPAGQPARHHPVHGDVRAHLFPDRARRARVRRRAEGDDRRGPAPAAAARSTSRCSAASCRLQKIDIAAAVIASIMVATLAVFFQKTRIGRALRAVADSHKAALSVGISLEQIWVIVWFAAGIVALATGIMWGARSNVSFALQIIALKALPVLILGGFTSIPGAIVGGVIIGVGEKIGEFYWGPLLGSRHRELARLRHRARLPAVPAAGPVRRADHRADLRIARVLPRSRTVQDELRGRRGGVPAAPGPHRHRGHSGPCVRASMPLTASTTSCSPSVMIPILVFSLAAIGLNILTGYTGLISLGTGGFMGVGAYACYKLTIDLSRRQHRRAYRAVGLLRGRRSACCSGCRRCASRASISRSRRSPRSSSCRGASSACRGSTTTTSPARSRCRPARCSAFRSPVRTRRPLTRYLVVLGDRRRDDLARLQSGAWPHRPDVDGGARHGHRRRADRHQALPDQAARLRGVVVLLRRRRRADGVPLARRGRGRQLQHQPVAS